MSALVISLAVFACVFAGALAGFALRRLLPEHHLSPQSITVVQLGTGLIATMAALVLGLLTASSKAKFDVQSDEVKQTAANLVLLDQALAHYGSETVDLRSRLKTAVAARVARWDHDGPFEEGSQGSIGELELAIRSLSPADDARRGLQQHALELATSVSATRWLAIEQAGSSVSIPFLVVMVFWLTAIFTSFGMMSYPNATVVAVLLVCAISVSIAIFLILELDQPFHGVIHIPSDPVRLALEHLGK